MTRVLKSLMVLFEPGTHLEPTEVNYKGFRFNSVSRIWASAKDARERMKGCVWGVWDSIPALHRAASCLSVSLLGFIIKRIH